MTWGPHPNPRLPYVLFDNTRGVITQFHGNTNPIDQNTRVDIWTTRGTENVSLYSNRIKSFRFGHGDY